MYDFTLGCLFLINPRDSRGWVKDLKAVFGKGLGEVLLWKARQKFEIIIYFITLSTYEDLLVVECNHSLRLLCPNNLAFMFLGDF